MTYNKQDKTLAEKATETVKGAMHKVGEILHMTPKIEKFREQFYTAKKNYDNYDYEKEYTRAAQSNSIKGLEKRIEIRKAYESLIEDHGEAIANLTKELYHELEKYEKEFIGSYLKRVGKSRLTRLKLNCRVRKKVMVVVSAFGKNV